MISKGLNKVLTQFYFGFGQVFTPDDWFGRYPYHEAFLIVVRNGWRDKLQEQESLILAPMSLRLRCWGPSLTDH